MLTPLLVTFLSLGGLCMALSIPLILRRIGPNWFYGFRTPKTMRDPQTWYDANAYAGRCLLVSGLVIVVVPAVLYLLVPHINLALFALIGGVVTLAAVLAALVQSLRYLGTLD